MLGLEGNQGYLHADVALLMQEQLNNNTSSPQTTSMSFDKSTDGVACAPSSWSSIPGIQPRKHKLTPAIIFLRSHPIRNISPQVIREHSGVEISVHWLLDVNFRDDDCRIRKRKALAKFAAIKRICLNARRRAPGKHSMKSTRLLAGWKENYLEDILRTR